MQEFPEYPYSISELLVNCPFGTGAALVKLKSYGFVITEEDPLIHAVIDCNNDDSVRYYNGGNFAVNPGFAGWLPWPEGAPPAPGAALPDGVEKTPPAVRTIHRPAAWSYEQIIILHSICHEWQRNSA